MPQETRESTVKNEDPPMHWASPVTVGLSTLLVTFAVVVVMRIRRNRKRNKNRLEIPNPRKR